MKIRLEKRRMLLSVAEYTVCVVEVEWSDYPEGCQGRRINFDEHYAIVTKIKEAAKKALETDQVDWLLTMSCPAPKYAMVNEFRRSDWEDEAWQSLKDMGLEDSDILSGKDMPFTDHSGIFMPRDGQ